MTSVPRSVEVRMEGLSLEGILNLPEGARPIVLFAHGFATLRFDLLTPLEDARGTAGATHLFEEPGALQKAATSASAWFRRYLLATPTRRTTTRTAPAPATREAHHGHAAS